MRSSLTVGLAAAALAAAAAPVAGQSGDPAIARGQMVALGSGMDQGQPACVQCHGMDGAADASGGVPRIGGQSGWYLYKTLGDYASGLRRNDVMTPVARALGETERASVAAWYAAVAPATGAGHPAAAAAPADLLQTGGALAAAGDPTRGVAACAGCHGPNGIGMAPVSPALAGQPAAYLAAQLRAWKEGRRSGDALDVMKQVSTALSEDQIRAVAAYYAAIAPAPAGVGAAPVASEAARGPTGATGSSGEKPPLLPGGGASGLRGDRPPQPAAGPASGN
ncbi:c-type cytochrome [Prosthecomicrobium sp. N25]|uniref:c-type cytochrome n=1 Tax=Prosthecomicrobium sp. N25 TaxID=3129254 RepID=UPI0030785DD7